MLASETSTFHISRKGLFSTDPFQLQPFVYKQPGDSSSKTLFKPATTLPCKCSFLQRRDGVTFCPSSSFLSTSTVMALAEGGGSSNFWYLHNSRNRQKAVTNSTSLSFPFFWSQDFHWDKLPQASWDKLWVCAHMHKQSRLLPFSYTKGLQDLNREMDPALKSIFLWKWSETLSIQHIPIYNSEQWFQDVWIQCTLLKKGITSPLRGLLGRTWEPVQRLPYLHLRYLTPFDIAPVWL